MCRYAAGGINRIAKVFATQDGEELCRVQAPQPINAVVLISVPRRWVGEDATATKLVVGTMGGLVHFYDIGTSTEDGCAPHAPSPRAIQHTHAPTRPPLAVAAPSSHLKEHRRRPGFSLPAAQLHAALER